jgi:exopolyphosphatase / guanosine-5'-triphosphate,3'-diphosphate pyrophosphatase
MTSGVLATIGVVRVAIVDIGSNTARLLVADVDHGASVADVEKRRAYLGLGEEIARTGTLSDGTIVRTARIARAYSTRGREQGAAHVQTIVTAPGRQGTCAKALVGALARATGSDVRVLSAEEEGRLAFDGALHRAPADLPEVIAVVDVGGGSSEIAVGTPSLGAAWIRSLDLGSLRLAQRALEGDPPSARSVVQARDLVRQALSVLDAPRPDVALAAGGSARAVSRVVGRTFGEDDLIEVIRIAERSPAAKLAKTFGFHPHRARTLLAGAVILREASRALERPLELAGGGVREGVALALARPAVAAA